MDNLKAVPHLLPPKHVAEEAMIISQTQSGQSQALGTNSPICGFCWPGEDTDYLRER